MKLYLLYFDTDHGSREEWNIFYTPCEVFDDPGKRNTRIDFLKSLVDEEGDPIGYEFHCVDTVLMTNKMMTEPPI